MHLLIGVLPSFQCCSQTGKKQKKKKKKKGVVHTITSSILILNTDLHSGMVEKKMSKKDFIENTNYALQENERVPEDFLKVTEIIFFFTYSEKVNKQTNE